MTRKNWQPTRTCYLVTFPVTFPEGQAREELLNAARNAGAKVEWVAVDPHEQNEHEYGFAQEPIWESLERQIQEWIKENDDLEWAGTGPGEWSQAERRRFIQCAVEKMGYLGPNGCDIEEVLMELGLATQPDEQ